MVDDDKLLIELGEKFGQIIAQSSFEFWEDKIFRSLIDFDSTTRTEQDRIFNELEVSALGLFILSLDQAARTSKFKEAKLMYSKLTPALIEGFLNLYKKLNLEQKYINEWRVLIDIRLEEYKKHFKISLKESKKLKEIKDDPELGDLWAKIETITIDSLSHIRKGNVKAEDPLWKILRRWLTGLEVMFEKLTLQISDHKAAIS